MELRGRYANPVPIGFEKSDIDVADRRATLKRVQPNPSGLPSQFAGKLRRLVVRHPHSATLLPRAHSADEGREALATKKEVAEALRFKGIEDHPLEPLFSQVSNQERVLESREPVGEELGVTNRTLSQNQLTAFAPKIDLHTLVFRDRGERDAGIHGVMNDDHVQRGYRTSEPPFRRRA